MSQILHISPVVHTKMMVHAFRNPHNVVHGILIGKYTTDGTALTISDVLPVCHSHPTKPLLDISLRLADAYCVSNEDSEGIVGWYTAPEKQVDELPGPVALKIVSSIANNSEKEPVLISITNSSIETFLEEEKSSDTDQMGFYVYREDEEKHWTVQYEEENIKSLGYSWEASNNAAVQVCLDDQLTIFDFEDHVSGGSGGIKEKDWIRNVNIGKAVSDRLQH